MLFIITQFILNFDYNERKHYRKRHYCDFSTEIKIWKTLRVQGKIS